MIKLTDPGGAAIYLSPAAIASVHEAAPSSQWHGIRAYVRTFGGKTYEVQQTAEEISVAADTALQRSEA